MDSILAVFRDNPADHAVVYSKKFGHEHWIYVKRDWLRCRVSWGYMVPGMDAYFQRVWFGTDVSQFTPANQRDTESALDMMAEYESRGRVFRAGIKKPFRNVLYRPDNPGAVL